MHFEACIVVEIGRTGRDLDWVSGTPEVCLASQSIASAAAFGGCLSSVGVQVGVDELIVGDEVAVALQERQSLESPVVETVELAEVATFGSVAKN